MQWKEVSESRYFEMLGVLPPAIMTGNGFLVGEAWDHNAAGVPRYQAFVELNEKFFEAEGSMTIREFKALTVAEVMKSVAKPITIGEFNAKIAAADRLWRGMDRHSRQAGRRAAHIRGLHAVDEFNAKIAAADRLLLGKKDDKEGLPYPWCRDPEACRGRGYCRRSPNCGD